MGKFVTVNEESIRNDVANWNDESIKDVIAKRAKLAFMSMDVITSEINKDIVKILEMVLLERENERKKPTQVEFETTHNKLKITHCKIDDEILIEHNNSLIIASAKETKKKLEKLLKSINESIQ